MTLHYTVKAWYETNRVIDLVEEPADWAFDTLKELLLLLPGHANAKGCPMEGKKE
jgi:hypothetical protein